MNSHNYLTNDAWKWDSCAKKGLIRSLLYNCTQIRDGFCFGFNHVQDRFYLGERIHNPVSVTPSSWKDKQVGFEWKNLRNNIYVYSFAFAMTLIQNKIMRQNAWTHVAFKGSMLLQLFVDNTRPAMPKTSLDFVFSYDVNQNLKKRFRRFLAFTS